MTMPPDPPVSLRLCLFGPFEGHVNGTPLPRLRSRKVQLLLALLTLRAGTEVARPWLAGLLWPGSAESTALATLRGDLVNLRRALGPAAARLRSPTPRTLCLELGEGEADILAFDAAVRRGDLASLERAVALYRGALLEGWTEEWVFQERQPREQAYLTVLERLAAIALERGETAEAERHLRQAIAVDPLREETQRALMQVLAAGGNYAAALLRYRELRQHLHRELNTEPDAETQTVFQQLRSEARRLSSKGSGIRVQGPGRDRHQLLHPDLPAHFPPLRSLDARPNNLPTQPSRLIGRDQEVTAVRAMLLGDELRLVTLTGPGGSGKTRLALAVAADLLDRFERGVFLVDLAPIRDPSLVLPTIAQTLGVREAGGLPLLEGVKSFLREKELLLVLDNFEQVLKAAPTVAELLRAAPSLKVLVTSRAVLRLQGEQEFPVPPLAAPDPRRLPPVEALPQYAAVELFTQRAVNAKPDFAVTSENARAVAEICHRLDGLPLALELAAARIRLLTPQAMLARLESRLKLLTGGARDAPARQQTLRDTIAWSYDLLGEAEKRLFCRLSVFAGGCTLEAVETVCDGDADLGIEVLDGIASLVEQNLLRQTGGPHGEPRFSMLETIREYGRERLAESGEEESMRRQHAHFFMTQAELAEPQISGPESAVWTQRWEVELNNLTAVLSWAEEHREATMGLRLLVAMRWLWVNGLHERLAYEALTKLLAFPEAADRNSLRGCALMLAGHLHNDLMADY